MNRDPVKYSDGYNLYQYVKCSPLRLRDPKGLQTWGPPANGPPGYGGGPIDYGGKPGPSLWDILINRSGYPKLIYRVKWDHVNYVKSFWRELPGYDNFYNTIHCPTSYYEGIKKKKLTCVQVSSLYNEVWHAWWDVALESDDDCAWLKDIFKQYAEDEYGGNWEAIDEAGSETAAQIVTSTCMGGTPTYDNSASPPGHTDEGEKWEDEPWADDPVSEDLYKWILYAMQYGCKKPTQHTMPGVGND